MYSSDCSNWNQNTGSISRSIPVPVHSLSSSTIITETHLPVPLSVPVQLFPDNYGFYMDSPHRSHSYLDWNWKWNWQMYYSGSGNGSSVLVSITIVATVRDTKAIFVDHVLSGNAYCIITTHFHYCNTQRVLHFYSALIFYYHSIHQEAFRCWLLCCWYKLLCSWYE